MTGHNGPGRCARDTASCVTRPEGPRWSPTLPVVQRIMLCANPAASGFTGGVHRAVLARLRDRFEVEAPWPETAADTRACSAAAAAEGYDAVVALGGDGVVHHVANGIGGTPTALGIIPAGTANVLARLLGIPRKAMPAAELICARPPARSMPVAMLTLDHAERGVESRLATFSCGVGFDADVVSRAEQEPHRKYSLAGLHYARTAASVAWTEYSERKPFLTVKAQGRSAEAVAVFVRLHDHYTYFGRIPVGFGPRRSEGLTLLVARSLSRRRILSMLGRVVAGADLGGIEGFEVWSGLTSLEISATTDGAPAQADGELLGSPENLSVAALGSHLRVLTPG